MRRWLLTPAAAIGAAALTWTAGLGAVFIVLARTTYQLRNLDRRELARGLAHFGYHSLPLSLVVATLTGATVVLQTGLYVQRFGARTHLGWAAGYAVLWEFGPLFLGLVMAARVGARNAAELATMKVGGQLEGLRGISLDPFAILVAPRVVASALSVACLATITFFVAILWEGVAAYFTLAIPLRVFFETFASMLDGGDLLGGVLKSTAYGLAIALISTSVGMSAQGGSKGVGGAAALAVVYSCAAIFALDFLLTPLLAGWLS